MTQVMTQPKVLIPGKKIGAGQVVSAGKPRRIFMVSKFETAPFVPHKP